MLHPVFHSFAANCCPISWIHRRPHPTIVRSIFRWVASNRCNWDLFGGSVAKPNKIVGGKTESKNLSGNFNATCLLVNICMCLWNFAHVTCSLWPNPTSVRWRKSPTNVLPKYLCLLRPLYISTESPASSTCIGRNTHPWKACWIRYPKNTPSFAVGGSFGKNCQPSLGCWPGKFSSDLRLHGASTPFEKCCLASSQYRNWKPAWTKLVRVPSSTCGSLAQANIVWTIHIRCWCFKKMTQFPNCSNQQTWIVSVNCTYLVLVR